LLPSFQQLNKPFAIESASYYPINLDRYLKTIPGQICRDIILNY
jgi:hypothetical protein